MDYKVVRLKREFFKDTESKNIIFMDEPKTKLIVREGEEVKYYRLVRTDENFKIQLRSVSLDKCIENATKEELYAMMPDIPRFKIDLIYKYFHRGLYETFADFAYNNYVAEATLYRYLKLIKETYLERINQFNKTNKKI